MARVLHFCGTPCPPSASPRVDHFGDGGSEFWGSRVLQKKGGCVAANFGSIPCSRRRPSGDACESSALRLRCLGPGPGPSNSRFSNISRAAGQKGVSVVEQRKEDGNSGERNRGASTSRRTGDNDKRRRHKSEIEKQRKESIEVSLGFPETQAFVIRSNSRHTYQTGIRRGAVQQPEVGYGKQETGRRSLDSTSDLGCEHFSRCSGCVVENALDRPPVLVDAAKFFKNYGISDFSFTSGSLWEWRCRAKLAVRGTSENPTIGLFEEGSHVIVDIPRCRTHHPRINAAVELVKEAIRALGIVPYDEESGLGQLRYVQMVVSTHDTSLPAAERYANGKVQISLVWNGRDESSPQARLLQPMAEFLWRRGGPRCSNPILHSIWANFQTSSTNVIFGGKWRHLLGEQEMWERISGADICFTPASFGQANLQAFEALLRKLQRHVKRGSAVVELYAGVGVIGISLASTRACRSVKCVEINKESKTSFQLSLSRVPDSVNCKISWHCADASSTPMSWLEGSDTVIVDPPRKGLDPSVIEALRTASLRSQGRLKSSPYVTAKVEKRPWVTRANQGVTKESSGSWDDDEMAASWPNTLIYVSCGWQSFKQDCAALLEDDAWHLDEGHAFNFFPGTDSIEVLAVFKSGKSGKKLKRSKKVKVVQKTSGRKTVSFNSRPRR